MNIKDLPTIPLKLNEFLIKLKNLKRIHSKMKEFQKNSFNFK